MINLIDNNNNNNKSSNPATAHATPRIEYVGSTAEQQQQQLWVLSHRDSLDEIAKTPQFRRAKTQNVMFGKTKFHVGQKIIPTFKHTIMRCLLIVVVVVQCTVCVSVSQRWASSRKRVDGV